MNSSHQAQCARALAVVGLTFTIACFGLNAMAQTTQHYKQTNLTSNQASLAPTMDGGLVNSWGLARSSTGPWWVADNGTGLSTLYNGTGVKQGLVVTIPTGDNAQSPTGTPTGTVFNGDRTAFLLASGKAAIFLFVTEDGTISGWNPGVSLGQAVIEVNHKSASVYKGVTIATVQTERGPQTSNPCNCRVTGMTGTTMIGAASTMSAERATMRGVSKIRVFPRGMLRSMCRTLAEISM
jgi:uncharacterized protein (TIGR03118 family)